MANVNDHKLGLAVRTLETMRAHRRGEDFPGWSAPDAEAYLKPPVAGLVGRVTDVESHGSNPWTRYAVYFADGTRASGLCEGTDIEFI